MWFVGYQSSGGAAQLYVADSPTVNGPYKVRYNYQNGGNPSFSIFDPTLYQDNSGNEWLIWAIEDGPTNSNNSIVSAELTPNGEGFATGSYSLLTYSSVNAGMEANNSGIPTGPNAQIENPDLITDPQGTYATNLTFSYGTYNQTYAYRTGNAACNGVTGPCGYNTSEMQNFANQVRGPGNPQNWLFASGHGGG